jgi:glycosyltransferase involved in cell wall biosynthesis
VTGAGGGPDKTILNTPRFLEPLGYRAICAYLRPPCDPGFEQLRQRAKSLAAPLVEINDRGPWDARIVSNLLEVCRRERVSIWHGHDYKTNLLGLVLSRFWPMRLVTTVHGWVKQTSRTPLYYWLDRWSLKYYERVVCVSEDLLQECLAAGVPSERCLLIENAIDTQQYCRAYAIAEAKRRLGLPDGRLLIGAVGRLSSEKGFDRLITAAAELLDQGLEFDLVIAGDGDQREHLQQQIHTTGWSPHIRLLGYCGELRDWYQAMDLFVLSSEREGLPNVLLEAMAFKVPVLATRIAGIPRLIEHGRNGWLVESDNTGELAAAMQRLVSDAGLRQALGQAGYQTIVDKYSFEKRMAKFAALFDGLLERRRPPANHLPCPDQQWQ